MTTPTQTPQNGESALRDPFDEFLHNNVQFDANGHTKLKSFHGLGRLLKLFYKEVMARELSQAYQRGREEERVTRRRVKIVETYYGSGKVPLGFTIDYYGNEIEVTVDKFLEIAKKEAFTD